VSLPRPPLLVITDRHQALMPLDEVAARLFAGGCSWLSLREKDLSAADRLVLLRRLVALGARWQARVMIHDDIATAAEAGAAGVHLQSNRSVAEARRLLGNDALIGQSAHNADEIAQAAAAGADYVTLSPIFATISKPGYGPALGRALLERTWPLPVLALGGIDASNAAGCMAAGAAGVAVMGGAMRARDPQAFMADLLARMGANLAPGPGSAHSSATALNGRIPT
jgi:thiamine-phosphate pyrophosphorylase